MRRLGNAGSSAVSETDAVTKMETVGLYDVTNVSTICPMVSEEENSSTDESWRLKLTSNERYLVLASCSDLTIFSLGETPEYYFTTSLGGTITDFMILGDSCFLVVVVDRSKIITLSLEKQEVYYNEPSTFPIDFVRSKTADDVCFVTFGSFSGQVHSTSLHGDVAEPKETNRIENWQTNQIVEFFTKAFTKTTSRNLNMKNVSSRVISISNGPVQSWASIGQKNDLMWCGFNSENFITVENEQQWVQVRDTGRYALCLSHDGFIHVFDPLTLMFCHKFDVKCGKKATVVDFIAIDHHICEVPTLFAIIAKINGKTEMMIYDQQKNENCFSISCAQQTALFGYSGSDRMLMSVEEITNDENDPAKSSIVIRQVSQSRPEMRFEALLKHHRFEEAEKFATTYKLDVQKVYKRRVAYLMDRCDNDDDVFADLMKTLDLITDHNMVADTYFSLVEMSTRFDRIHTYLCNAKKRKVTDMDVLKQIENASFILATYRIIIGPKSRSQSELNDRIWDLFVDCLHGVDRWVELYMNFLSISAITRKAVMAYPYYNYNSNTIPPVQPMAPPPPPPQLQPHQLQPPSISNAYLPQQPSVVYGYPTQSRGTFPLSTSQYRPRSGRGRHHVNMNNRRRNCENCDSLAYQSRKTEGEHKDERDRRRAAEDKYADEKRKVSSLHDLIKENSDKLQDAEKIIAELTLKVQDLDHSKKEDQKTIEELKDQISQKHDEVQKALEDLDRYEEELQTMKIEYDVMKTGREEAIEAEEKGRSEHKQAQDKISEIVNEILSERNKNIEKEAEIISMNDQLSVVSNENSVIQEKIEELKGKNLKYEQSIVTLTEQLRHERSNKDYDGIQTKLKEMEKSVIDKEARVIWSRHGSSILEHMVPENGDELVSRFDYLFQTFGDALTSDINCWSGIIEHVTVDLFQECLNISELLVPRVENLVSSLVRLLEYRDTSNWPDNAIKVSSCFDNMTQILSDNCVTPSDQSFLALKGRVLCAPDDTKSTPLLRMKKLHHILQDIKRLKEVYGCSISYNTYLNLSSEEICHKILQNALYNPNTILAEIEKNVKPFMAERHLNQDQTIFNYIQIMSGGSKMNVNTIIGWEKQCVHLCASLSDESKRCQSIISIASSAKLPWPSVLEESVEKILNSRSLSRAEIDDMLIVCRKTELTRLLSSYGYDRSFINLFTDDDVMIDIVLVIRCVLAQIDKQARFVDCIKILELFTFVQKTDWRKAVHVEYARAQAVIQMMRTGEMTTSIIGYINDLEEQEREVVTDLVVSFIKSVADTPAALSNTIDRDAVLNIGEEILSYTTRRNNVESENYRNLHKKLILIRELQKEEENAVLLSDLENETWKKSQLRKMTKSGKKLDELLTKCVYIGIEYESLIGAIIGKAIGNQDVRAILEVFVESVESVGPWISASKDLVDLMCELLGWIVYRLPNLSPDTSDMEKAEDIAIVVGKLVKGIRTMIAVFPFEIISDEFDFLMQIEAYLHLCERVVKQSLRGQDTETMRGQNSNQNELDSFLASSNVSNELKIYGFALRHGTFDYSSDPALFEGVSGVLAIANVAPSVARPFDSEIKEDLANEYRSSWEHLTMFLAMHSQDLLDISARVYASSLQCFSGEWRQSILEIGQSVLTVTERMLQQDKFDAWHAATLLFGLPIDQIHQKVAELRISNGAKRNTKSQLNFLTLAFFVAMLLEKDEVLPAILFSYEQKYLAKQLAKEGIRVSIGQSQDVIDKIIAQSAELSTPLLPDRLYDYVKKIVDKFMRNHSVSVSEYMIRYATILIRKASSSGNATDSQQRCVAIDRYLDLASSALFRVEEDKYEIACNYLSCLLYTVCPYNYEVVQFISHKIALHANTVVYTDFCQNLQNIMNFLWLYKRTNHITREESVWFTKRERTLMLHEKDHEKYLSRMSDPFGYQLKMSYEGSTDQMSETMGSDSSYPADAMVYEKNDVIISDIPPLSSKRIPFHVFLMRKKQDIDDIVMPIVKSELSIYNVPIWQAALRNVSWLSPRFSRTQLLSSAIFSHANKFATVEKVLPQGDKNVIFQLLDSTTNRSVVISTIALLFKKIMLSDVKIDLLQMGVDMAERWVQTENIEPPIKNDEKEAIAEQCFRLKDGIAKFFTELSLKKNGLYNEKTADNIENVEELCTLIYGEMVDWTNTMDVEEKCTIVEKIADANGLNLTQLHEKLLYDWIDDSSENVNYEQLDMNDTLGENSYMDRQVDDAQVKDDMTRLPLFDRSVEKMTFLSKRIEKKGLLRKLAGIILKGGSKGITGYNAVARATCILLRTSTAEDLLTLNENASHFWICENLENQMYLRLHDMTNMKIQTDVEKTQLIRTLLQCPSRTPMMTSLIACLMVDFEYKDIKNIEQIMARLQIAKQWNVLKALLSYARNQKLDSMMRSFPLLWFRVYENALTEIDGGSMVNKQWNNSQCVSLRKWSLWAMGCNVEGGRQTGVSRLLRELSCPVSAAISSVLSNFTVNKMDDVSMNCMDPKRDLPMMWAKMVPTTQNIKMEH